MPLNYDFSLSKYKELCETLLRLDYMICTVHDYLSYGQYSIDKPIAIIRHDVDRRPSWAHSMALLEKSLDIRSTYYFRQVPHVFKPQIIKAIHSWGHEIGFHYESLAQSRGNSEIAIKNFSEDLKKFRQLCPVDTICMHGSPMSRWDNRHLWQAYSMKDYGILGEPYLSIDYSKVKYFSDTGRTWNPNQFNIRDHVGHNKVSHHSVFPQTTDQLMEFLEKNPEHYLIQTHPERWANSLPAYCWSWSWDAMANLAKLVLKWGKK